MTFEAKARWALRTYQMPGYCAAVDQVIGVTITASSLRTSFGSEPASMLMLGMGLAGLFAISEVEGDLKGSALLFSTIANSVVRPLLPDVPLDFCLQLIQPIFEVTNSSLLLT